MRIVEDTKLDFQDVLLKPKRSTIASRKDVKLARVIKFKHSTDVWEGIPLISANMTSVTTRDVAFVMERYKMLACLPKSFLGFLGMDNNHTIRTFGLNETISVMCNEKFICLDVANGYTEKFSELVYNIRKYHSNLIIMAGNVVSPEMTEALILAGADIVKVGIGSGSACSTRLQTGVGYPQFSAIIECADAAHGLGGHICSDGGCASPGDVAKAFGAGADFVMLGGILAGHTENGEDFYGMSSKRANEEMAGGLKDYRAAEGLELKLPSRGNLEDTLKEITGGLRSACAYVGAKSLKDLPKCATFIKCNRQLNTSLWDYKI
jgi:GMP reductase